MTKEGLSNEDEVQEWLFKILLKKGWTVEREVPIDETKSWNNPYRIDLVVFKSEYGKINPMGIEVKFITGIRQGGRISEAFDQILYKYAKGHVKGQKFETICIAAYYDQTEKQKRFQIPIIKSIHIFTKGLLTYWGIGYLNLNENPLRIQFGSDAQNDMKIHIKYDHPDPQYKNAYENKYVPNEDKILKKSSHWKKLLN